jgi:hypothetical protein
MKSKLFKLCNIFCSDNFIATCVVQVRWRHNRSQELDGEVRQNEAGTLSILREAFPKRIYALKGLGHQMNIFWRPIKFVLSVHAPLVIKFLRCSVEEKKKDFACFYENPSQF